MCVTVLMALGWSTVGSGQEVRINISATDTSVRVGQPIPLKIELENTSDGKVKVARIVGQGQAELDYRISLADAAGHAVPRTKYGGAADTGNIDIVSQTLVTVQPHRALAQHTELTKLFKIIKPGLYTVRVGRRWPPKSKNIVWSNSLTITVTN